MKKNPFRRFALFWIMLLGFLFGKYKLVQSAIAPLSIVKSKTQYCDPRLDYAVFHKLLELYYGDDRNLDITIKPGKPGIFLYKDADYLYVESHDRVSVLGSLLHNFLPWVFSQKLRDRGLKIDSRTAKVWDRMSNKWVGVGIIPESGPKLASQIPKGYGMYDFAEVYGASLRTIIIPREGKKLFYALVYLDRDLKETSLVFDLKEGYFGISSNVCELVRGDAPECLPDMFVIWSSTTSPTVSEDNESSQDSDKER